MSATVEATVITEPCVVDGMPDDVYHRDPVPAGSLSSTGIKRLLPPSCPAKFKHYLGEPEHKRAYDIGHAAHKLVLGEGMDLCVIEADNYKTAKAQAQQQEAYDNGQVPLLRKEYEQVKAMAAAVRDHDDARGLLDPDSGRPEQSLFWIDRAAKWGTDEWLRARVDWLRFPQAGRRLVLCDYKTADSADPDAFSKAAWDYGYAVQDRFYSNGAIALGLDEDPIFAFIVQEKKPPFLVNVITLDANARRIANIRIREAIDLYHQCKTTDTWPGYPGVDVVSLPAYIERQFEDDTK